MCVVFYSVIKTLRVQYDFPDALAIFIKLESSSEFHSWKTNLADSMTGSFVTFSFKFWMTPEQKRAGRNVTQTLTTF